MQVMMHADCYQPTVLARCQLMVRAAHSLLHVELVVLLEHSAAMVGKLEVRFVPMWMLEGPVEMFPSYQLTTGYVARCWALRFAEASFVQVSTYIPI